MKQNIQELIADLKVRAPEIQSVRQLIEWVRAALEIDRDWRFAVVACLWKAFGTSISTARSVEQFELEGPSHYSDEEIDAILMPYIRSTATE